MDHVSSAPPNLSRGDSPAAMAETPQRAAGRLPIPQRVNLNLNGRNAQLPVCAFAVHHRLTIYLHLFSSAQPINKK